MNNSKQAPVIFVFTTCLFFMPPGAKLIDAKSLTANSLQSAQTSGEVASCSISIKALASIKSKSETVLFDVRDSADYQTFHITDALHTQLHLIKTKHYLKNKTLVLIGKGHQYAKLINACRHLTAQGFSKVSVLKAGTVGWLNQQKIKLNHQSGSSIYEMSASEVFQSNDLDKVLFVNLGKKDSAIVKKYFNHSLILTAKQSNKNIITKVNQILSKIKHGFDYIIVAGNALPVQVALLTQMDKKTQSPVYRLKGGLDSLLKFQNDHYAMTHKKVFNLQKAKSCSN